MKRIGDTNNDGPFCDENRQQCDQLVCTTIWDVIYARPLMSIVFAISRELNFVFLFYENWVNYDFHSFCSRVLNLLRIRSYSINSYKTHTSKTYKTFLSIQLNIGCVLNKKNCFLIFRIYIISSKSYIIISFLYRNIMGLND